LEKDKQFVMDWVDANKQNISDWHQIIWNFAEPSLREYKSSRWYVDFLRADGWDVEECSGGMPTAFCATWSNGDGPCIGGYAEYDAVPGNCQAADTVEKPRDGLSKHAPSHTDPHSMLGIASLGGFLSAKAAMKEFNICGKLKFMGEPAEKLRMSKPIHAANGYYDEMDAAISWHPFGGIMFQSCNTTAWDTHSCVGYSLVYTFETKKDNWFSVAQETTFPGFHASARCPGANDAAVSMYLLSKMFKEHMYSANSGCSMNEIIINSGQATADNLPAPMSQIQFFIRTPEIAIAETIVKILDNNAESAANASFCTWKRDWICKSRPGLPNHVLADATYKNLEIVGPPKYGKAAIKIAQEIQQNLGYEPLEKPFSDILERLITPQEAEKIIRETLPPWQKYYVSDDYTEYCWHTPTVRMFIARPSLKPCAKGEAYPKWVSIALGGIRECTDPTFMCASKTIGLTIVDLLVKPEILRKAKEEFNERTGGGVGGTKWIPPLCDYEPAISIKWPEYITTARGENQWVIPAEGDR